jgi:hypothetical protein
MIGAMNDRGSCGWNMEQAGLVTVVLQKKHILIVFFILQFNPTGFTILCERYSMCCNAAPW